MRLQERMSVFAEELATIEQHVDAMEREHWADRDAGKEAREVFQSLAILRDSVRYARVKAVVALAGAQAPPDDDVPF